jgi:hypothetical protein
MVPKPPSRTDIARMERRGCAILGKHGVELEVNQRWTHEEVTEFLEKLLPLPFAYARKNLKHTRRSNRCSVPLWVLLNKENRGLDIVPNEQPNGADLYRYKGRGGASAAESHVYIGESSSLQCQARRTFNDLANSTSGQNPRGRLCYLGSKLSPQG